jgi:hypothetical protein
MTSFDFIAARGSIFEAPIPGPLKLVALVLVEHMPNCHPSVSKIASMCGVERKTAIRALARLERLGVISVERRNGALNAYAFRPVPLWRTGTSEVPVPESNGTGTNEGTGPVPTEPETSPSEVHKAVISTKEAGERRGRARGLELADASTIGPDWIQYPVGWAWSAATQAEADMQGVTAAQLQEHVNYWSLHKFSRPCTDLDGELRRRLPDIRKRGETERAKPGQAVASTGNSYAWMPTQEHRDYVSEHGRDIAIPIAQYRAAGTPDRAPSTLAANADFMRRLRCWVATGTFIATGPLPKRPAQERSTEQT